MSAETLDIYNDHRKEEIENGPFSETFTTASPSGSFSGIFDRSHIEDNKDSGNVQQKKLYPRIMVSEVPEGIEPQTTTITREKTSDTFTFWFVGKDDEGVPYLWLV